MGRLEVASRHNAGSHQLTGRAHPVPRGDTQKITIYHKSEQIPYVKKLDRDNLDLGLTDIPLHGNDRVGSSDLNL